MEYFKNLYVVAENQVFDLANEQSLDTPHTTYSLYVSHTESKAKGRFSEIKR